MYICMNYSDTCLTTASVNVVYVFITDLNAVFDMIYSYAVQFTSMSTDASYHCLGFILQQTLHGFRILSIQTRPQFLTDTDSI